MAKPFKIPETAEATEASAWLSTPPGDYRNSCTLTDHFPQPFAAYARVFHPAKKEDASGRRPVRWGTVAEANNTEVHRLMQWPNIAKVGYRALYPTTADASWSWIPSAGTLPSGLAAILATTLRQFTTTPESCWFAVWDGHGFSYHPWMQAAPSVDINGQPYRLFTGPIEVATASFHDNPHLLQSANMWWPSDRAWLVATHIDLNSTYVGGSGDAIEAILNESRLETFRAVIDDVDTLEGDLINPAV